VFALAVLVGKVTVESLEIYNRWGQKVYESTDQQAQWDGRANGEEAASDVYVYKIRWRKGDGSLTIKTGEVTLLR
jgi:trimeric autotransporter adhesin